MSKSWFITVCAAVAIAIAAGPCRADDDMIGISRTREVYAVDSTTGTGWFLDPGNTLFSTFGAMAKHQDGTLLALQYTRTTLIASIDPATGVQSRGGVGEAPDLAAAAFTLDGTLYAIETNPSFSGCYLYRLNWPAVGSTLIDELPNEFRYVQGMAIDSRGRAYIWDTQVGLARINLETAEAFDISTEWGGTNEILCLAFDSNDNLFGARDGLYRINTTDGSYELIGSGGYFDLRGIEFDPGGGYRLRVRGECPGTVTVIWSGARASRQQGVLFGLAQGAMYIPSGICAGTRLGIDQNVRLVTMIGTGGGSGSVSGEASPAACGGFLQLIEIPMCSVSNPFQLHE